MRKHSTCVLSVGSALVSFWCNCLLASVFEFGMDLNALGPLGPLLGRGLEQYAVDLDKRAKEDLQPKATVDASLELSYHHRKLKNFKVGQLEWAIVNCKAGVSQSNLDEIGGNTSALLRRVRGMLFNRHTSNSSKAKRAQKKKKNNFLKIKKMFGSTYKSRLLVILSIINGLDPDSTFRDKGGPGLAQIVASWAKYWLTIGCKDSLVPCSMHTLALDL